MYRVYILSIALFSAESQASPISQCSVTAGGLKTSDEFRDRVAPKLQSQALSFLSTTVSVGGTTLMWSAPGNELRKTMSQVESFVIRTNSAGAPISISGGFKKALGSPMLTVATVDVVRPNIAPGPTISDKDIKASTPKQSKDSEDVQEDEPSFLRKYWWVIAGAMLLSSVFGPNEAPGANGGAATQPAASSNK